jgi:Na+/proline symporter
MFQYIALHWPVLLASVFPILIYLIVGIFAKSSKVATIDDYFIYSQQVGVNDYANTSVGYALQMAAMFLFAYWGIIYGLGALWTAIFWFCGFALLYRLLPKFLPFHDNPTTLHQYLAERFGKKSIQRLAAAATIIGLWGTMMAELDYTMQVYSPLVTNTQSTFIIQTLFLAFGVLYIIVNGYKAEVNTERIQVPFAYAGLIAVLILTLPAVWIHSGPKAYTVIFALFIITLLLMVVGKMSADLRRPLHDWQVWIPLLALAGLVGVGWWVHSSGLRPGANSTILDAPLFGTQLKAQGYFALFSLFIANVFWMPVDFSTWQRVASVEGKNQEGLERLRRGTWRVMFESPASWCLGIVLGLIIHAGGFIPQGTDPSEALPSFSTALENGVAARHFAWAAGWLYPLFIIACISIMLSTVDSIISAIAFTADRDLPITPESRKNRLAPARLWTLGIVVVGLGLYPLLRFILGANLPTFLYAAYSMQLSLLVIVLLALYNKRLDGRAAVASVLCGFIATGIAFYLAIRVPDPDAAVLPPVFAVLGATVGYAMFFRRGALALNTSGKSTDLKL